MATPNITLYYAKGACSLAPHIILYEVGKPFTAALTTRPPTLEFQKLNPKLKVPVLVLDNEVITETPAIFLALAALAPELQLFGKTHMENVRVHEWVAWLAGAVHGQGFGGLFRPERYSLDPATHAGIKEKARQSLTEYFNMIEGKLDGVHAVGGAFTVVDAYLLVFYRWAVGNEWTMSESYPKYTALVEELLKRPSVGKALDAEGLKSTL